jgi:ubiquinone/menaquinone biosynthesis C-methylase UbiE
MTVLDMGCGPGFFPIDMAKMVGKEGKVIASDLQEGMLERLKNKITNTEFEKQITLVKSEENKICAPGNIDFILMFFLGHEVADLEAFFKEITSTLKPGGQALMVEPPLHVSKKAFEDAIQKAHDAGLSALEGPKVFFGKTVIFQKA